MRRACYHHRAKRGFAALIEIVAVAALILVGFVVYFNMMGGGKSSNELVDPTGTTTAVQVHNDLAHDQAPDGHPAEGAKPSSGGQGNAGASTNSASGNNGTNVVVPSSIPGRAIYKAHGVQCEENLRQLRMMIRMATEDNDNTIPASLTDVPDSIQVRTCPISGKDYTYDPSTGEVHCTTPGHENF